MSLKQIIANFWIFAIAAISTCKPFFIKPWFSWEGHVQNELDKEAGI